MILHRRTTNVYSDREQESAEWKCYGEKAHVDFREFGAGSERVNWSKIRLGWSVVGTIVQIMVDGGCAGAKRVRDALKLADAVQTVSNNPIRSIVDK